MSVVTATGLGLVTVGTPAPRRESAATLEALARDAGRDLEGAPAEEIARWATDTFGSRFCVTSSMADAVVAHLFSRVAPGVDVVFLDTGLHFPETLKVRDTVARTMNVNVRSIRPRLTVGQQDGEYGPRLFARSPDECCFLRKVEPLERALADADCWISGVRRDQSPSRAGTEEIGWDARRGLWKANPLAAWSEQDIWLHIHDRGLPYHPLHDRGYSSIGCAVCTLPGEGREGRWAGTERTECGLHPVSIT